MRQSTVALLLLLAGTIFAAWFFTAYEKVTKDEFTGYRGEARVNSFLAADLLLNELGIEADSRSALTPSKWLPEHSDTIVSRLSAAIAIESEQDTLMAWVAEGGHLVLLPPQQPSRMTDEFLEYLGARLVEVGEDAESGSDDESTDEVEPESFAYLVDLDSTPYRIEMRWEETVGATLADEKGLIAVRFERENGYITMVSNSLFFENDWIKDSDHARLLLDTVAGYLEPGTVWFIYDAAFPSLWQVIWDNAAYVVISVAIMLIFWLWSVMPKFGPEICPDPIARRSIIEHVRAAGHFVWRNHATGALATSSSAAILHEAEFRHPGIGRLPADAQAKQLAAITGIPAQEILYAITSQDEPRHREFTHNMQVLQRIRKEL